MAETIFGIVEISGVLFILYKIINKIAQVCDLGEVTNLMGESLAMRTGNFSSKRKD
jgi:hypothetical protein